MPKHLAPTPPRSKKPFIWSGVGVVLLALIVLFVCNGGPQVVVSGVAGLFSDVSQATSTQPTSPTTATTAPSESSKEETPPTVQTTFPAKELRGVWLRPGIDYTPADEGQADSLKKELATVFGQLEDWGINALLLPLHYEGKALYQSDAAAMYTDWDVIDYITALARTGNIQVFGVWELSTAGDLTAQDAAEKVAATAKVVGALGLDGVWLDGYETASEGDYATFIAAGGGDRTAFVRTQVTATVTAAVTALRAADADGVVGLLASALWADNKTEGGCAVTGLSSAYAAGADTRAWVQSGLFDAVMPLISTPIEDKQADFAALFDWWAALCTTTDRPLCVSLDIENKWVSPDQPARQLLHCRANTAFKGGFFDSYVALKQDRDGVAKALFRVYDGTLLSKYITDTLVISEPSKTTFTTKESQLTFTGTADPNFPLYVGKAEISLTKHGFFSWSTTLTPGENKVVFTHKGKTVTYRITYEVALLESVTPSKDLTPQGGSTLTVSAIARKGASVYAMLNGKKITMKETPLQEEEDGAAIPTDFENFSGTVTMPKGIVEKTQALGKVTVYASYKGLTETMTGGSVTVAAEPKPQLPENSGMSGSSGEFLPGTLTGAPTMPNKLTTIDPAVGGKTLATGKIVVVTGNFAQTYRVDSANMSRPEYAYLPRGTTDVVVDEVYNGNDLYYKLGSNRLIKATREVDMKKLDDKKATVYDVTVVESYKSKGTVTENTLTGARLNIGYDYTVLYLGTTWRVPYDLRLLPQRYTSASAADKKTDPDYDVKEEAAEYVELTFYYTTAVPVLPDLSGSPLFSSAKWTKGENNTYILRLYLRDKGAFYGYSVAWDENGNLVLAFRHPQTVTGTKPLSGFKVVLDPGHGANYGRPTFAPGVSEHIQCLDIAKLLRDKLKALGATVVLTREDNSISPDLYDRADYARNTDADLFLSLHTNAANGNARGISVFYYNLYSHDLATLLAKYGAKTYKTFTGSGSYTRPGWENTYSFNRGASWSPLNVTRIHDCPAILIECGFLDNAEDRELLIDPKFQSAFCDNLVDAIVEHYTAAPHHSVTITTNTTTGSGVSQSTTVGITGTSGSATSTAASAA